MPCYKPLKATLWKGAKKNGKSSVSFDPSHFGRLSNGGVPTPIPCGQCIGCRLERSRQWAIRLVKELRLHDRSSFLTLTYDDTHLPRLPSGKPTLVLEDVQLFLKRLRRHFEPHPLRFFQCGEYGDAGGRPHHHMILFGEDFCLDRKPIRSSASGYAQFESATLTSLWGKGFCTISDVTFESSAYVARYSLKKSLAKALDFSISALNLNSLLCLAVQVSALATLMNSKVIFTLPIPLFLPLAVLLHSLLNTLTNFLSALILRSMPSLKKNAKRVLTSGVIQTLLTPDLKPVNGLKHL